MLKVAPPLVVKHRGLYMSTRSRRLDDRIRELCAKVVASKDSEALTRILAELTVALHQSIERLRTRAIAILTAPKSFPDERRKIS